MMLKTILKFSFILTAYLSINSSYAQSKLNSVELEDINTLILEKRNLEANNEIKSTYRLQIFSGTIEEATKTQEKFNSLDLNIKSKIVYQTPNYKVWVGDFRSRIQADRAFEKIKEDYPNTLIIRPGK